MIFYRYIRPLKFNSKRVQLETYARGGVCIRFESHPDSSLWFTHARCHPDELFSKDTARKIADHRAEILDPIFRSAMQIPNLKSLPELIESVQLWCDTWQPAPYPPVARYLAQEAHELGVALNQICTVNRLEQEKLDTWIVVQQAAQHKLNYDRISG